MRYLKSYNESIMAKTKEIFSPIEIAKNNKISQRYIDYIMSDYRIKKNLFAAKISINDGFISLWYKITDNPKESPGESYSNSPYTLVKLSYIKNPWSWPSDKSGGRIEVENNRDIILGRVINTGEIIEDKDGIKIKDAISYLNISASVSKKVIDFFINEYKKKYPQLSDSKYFNKYKILEVDPDLANKLDTEYKSAAKKREEEWLSKIKDCEKFIKDNFKYSTDDIKEYALSLTEIEAYMTIEQIKYSDVEKKYAICKTYHSGHASYAWSTTIGIYDCTDGGSYYLVNISFHNPDYIDEEDEEGNDVDGVSLDEYKVSPEVEGEIERFLKRMKSKFELISKDIENSNENCEYLLLFREK